MKFRYIALILTAFALLAAIGYLFNFLETVIIIESCLFLIYVFYDLFKNAIRKSIQIRAYLRRIRLK